MGDNELRRRLAALISEIQKTKAGGLLVTEAKNVRYLSGFKGDDATLVITPTKKFFLTDSRYLEDAEKTVRGFEIVRVRPSHYEAIEEVVRSSRISHLGFESSHLPYQVAVRLKSILKGTRLIPTSGMVENLRMIKSENEVVAIRRSVRLAKGVLKTVLKNLRPGISEQTLATIIETGIINAGAKPAFDPIVAYKANSSKPHAVPSSARIRPNGHLMIDIGANLGGYNSDLTRTVFLGKVKEKMKLIYRIAHEAQGLAIAMVRPGIKASEVDRTARNHITKNGFGSNFGHSLGHGIGLEVHEKPSISPLSQDVLSPGMVFTIEPAIYIAGVGGVRVEDMVLVTKNGCKILTR